MKIIADNERYVLVDYQLQDCTCNVTVLKPNQRTRGHNHPYPELYLFLYGKAKLGLNSDETEPRLKVIYKIPLGTFHQVTNLSGTDLVVFATQFQAQRIPTLQNHHG